jgi:hypothetical protein
MIRNLSSWSSRNGWKSTFNLLDFYRKGLRLSGLTTSFLDAEGCAAVLRNLGPGFDQGTLRAGDSRTIPAKEGWDGVHAGGER